MSLTERLIDLALMWGTIAGGIAALRYAATHNTESPRATFGGPARGDSHTHPSNQEEAA